MPDAGGNRGSLAISTRPRWPHLAHPPLWALAPALPADLGVRFEAGPLHTAPPAWMLQVTHLNSDGLYQERTLTGFHN